MEHKSTLRVVGILVLVLIGLSIGIAQSAGVSMFQTLFEIFILIIGAAGTLGLQLIIWPERFLPRKPEPELQRSPIPTESPRLPDLRGQIMGVLHGQFQNPQNASETLTGFCLFVSLTNQTLSPAHIRDYEFYDDIGSGFERMNIFRGIAGSDFHFGYQNRELQIDNFQQRLLSYRNTPIEFGIPYEGILLFYGPERFYLAPVQAYKLVVVDVFGQRHEMVTRSSDLPDPGYIADHFGVRGI